MIENALLYMAGVIYFWLIIYVYFKEDVHESVKKFLNAPARRRQEKRVAEVRAYYTKASILECELWGGIYHTDTLEHLKACPNHDLNEQQLDLLHFAALNPTEEISNGQ